MALIGRVSGFIIEIMFAQFVKSPAPISASIMLFSCWGGSDGGGVCGGGGGGGGGRGGGGDGDLGGGGGGGGVVGNGGGGGDGGGVGKGGGRDGGGGGGGGAEGVVVGGCAGAEVLIMGLMMVSMVRKERRDGKLAITLFSCFLALFFLENLFNLVKWS